MGWSIVAQTKAASSNTTSVTSPEIDTRTAKLILLWVVNYQPGPDNAPEDSEGNTWTPLTAISNATANRGRWYYCLNPVTSEHHTFTIPDSFPTVSYPTIFIRAWTHEGTIDFDAESSGVSEGNFNSTSVECGEVTPSADDVLVLAGLALYNTVTDVVIDSGFDTPDTILTSSTNIPGGVSHKIINGGSGVPVNAEFSWTGGSFSAAIHAVFKVGAGQVGNPWYAYAHSH